MQLRNTMNNKPQTKLSLDKSLMAAALLLPLIAAPAHAETAPEKTTIAYKYLDYLDSQPDADRIGVKAHALLLTKPVNDEWSFTATAVNDVVSGASPRNHTQRLTNMHDVRDGYSLGVTRYLPTGTATVTGSYSTESDYVSRSVSATGVWFTNDTKNTALTAGVGITRDDINPSNRIVVGEKKSVDDLMLGLTQVFSPVDIVQVNLRYSRGNGYFTDPYKDKDKRPSERNVTTLLTRWNHHFQSVDGTLRTSYRYYSDSYKINAHTLGLEYAQAAGHGWTLTPLVRLHSQNAAWFYSPYDPAGRSGMTRPGDGPYTTDQRMSAYGAITTGLKVARQLTPDLVVDVKFEKYRQYGTWAISGQGDPGLATFKARSVQVGLSYQF
jgi:hypothetical protein